MTKLDALRRVLAVAGAIAVLTLGIQSEAAWSEPVAILALVALAMASFLLFVETAGQPRPWVAREWADAERDERSRRGWWLASAVVAAGAALAAQSWFGSTGAIGGGDVAPAVGIAWTRHVFDPWLDYNLGTPGALEPRLPWAAALRAVTALGGSPALAQRLWFTALFCGAGLAALYLLRVVSIGPRAAVVGVAVFLFNPYVVSVVGVNPVYIAGMMMLALLPAVVLAAGRGRLRVRVAALVIGCSAPVVGYVYQNPPLVGMILATTIATVLLSLWLGGRRAAYRSALAVGLGMPLMLMASAYWIAPSVIQLGVVAKGQLSSFSSWSFTETRATVANALWLNTTWGWRFPEYYPYAGTYSSFPLSLLRFVLPAAAFAALALPTRWRRGQGVILSRARLGMAAVAGTIALALVFISTGTRPPAAPVFKVMYKLPLGWVLREPGRFLMLAGMAYAIMIALVADWSLGEQRAAPAGGGRRWLPGRASLRLVVALVSMVGLGYPLASGAVVPDSRPLLPSEHVRVPATWPAMARFVATTPPRDAVVVMPPNDFYQMPYTWGYYGADDFIFDLFDHPIIDPVTQGYTPASRELATTMQLLAGSIVSADWDQATRLMDAVGARSLLVRGDIKPEFPGRQITAPAPLAAALSRSPVFSLAHREGDLELYTLSGHRETLPPVAVAVNSTVPDLRLLPLLPARSRLVTLPPAPSLVRVDQVPGLETWTAQGNQLTTSVSLPGPWSYSLVVIDGVGLGHVRPVGAPVPVAATPRSSRGSATPPAPVPAPAVAGIQASVEGEGATRRLNITERGTGNLIPSGDFATGQWGPVDDCNNQAPKGAALSASTVGIPGGETALRLSALHDAACEHIDFQWAGGPVVIKLAIRHVSGADPRICLWQPNVRRCASLPDIPTSSGWIDYSAAVRPAGEPGKLAMYLYADGEGGAPTVNEYAGVRIYGVSDLPSVALIGLPPAGTTAPSLYVGGTTFSPQWQDRDGAHHVLVDGLVNGWLSPPGAPPVTPTYRPSKTLRDAIMMAFSGLAGLGILALSLILPHRRARRRVRGTSGATRRPPLPQP